jgi:hypothetical protein
MPAGLSKLDLGSTHQNRDGINIKFDPVSDPKVVDPVHKEATASSFWVGRIRPGLQSPMSTPIRSQAASSRGTPKAIFGPSKAPRSTYVHKYYHGYINLLLTTPTMPQLHHLRLQQ